MTKEEKQVIKDLINQWLETLNTEGDYLDNLWISDKEMAEIFIKNESEPDSFFNWLDKKEIQND